ncbi:hypothetical protein EYF80_025547 [Liparis tanakae]|uniref:Uncharacterized protein n=1 Tax=Liparis tanakae TaxID=230148 RepID=A0A4Z2HF13_9TELE|nr:hypothetical protein EYF80_025547 [Liparis tanakae]
MPTVWHTSWLTALQPSLSSFFTYMRLSSFIFTTARASISCWVQVLHGDPLGVFADPPPLGDLVDPERLPPLPTAGETTALHDGAHLGQEAGGREEISLQLSSQERLCSHQRLQGHHHCRQTGGSREALEGDVTTTADRQGAAERRQRLCDDFFCFLRHKQTSERRPIGELQGTQLRPTSSRSAASSLLIGSVSTPSSPSSPSSLSSLSSPSSPSPLVTASSSGEDKGNQPVRGGDIWREV